MKKISRIKKIARRATKHHLFADVDTERFLKKNHIRKFVKTNKFLTKGMRIDERKYYQKYEHERLLNRVARYKTYKSEELIYTQKG